MSEQRFKGSWILKILIVLLALVLVAVIYIPDKTWKMERKIIETSRNNLVALYETENYHYSKTRRYLPGDSLEALITFADSDSALIARQKIGQLTHELSRNLDGIMQLPLIKALLPISKSLNEITDELNFNSRYFSKYEHIAAQSEAVLSSLPRFSSGSVDFPNFSIIKNYVDSLSILKERIGEYKLQNAALLGQRYLDSLNAHINNIEMGAVTRAWNVEYNKISALLKDVRKTDIILVSTVADRTKKFIDRIKSSMEELARINLGENIHLLQMQKEYLNQTHESFLTRQNFFISQNYGIMQLNEVDSLLVKLNEDNLYCPDTFEGKHRYIVHYRPGHAGIVVECPNLLDNFQKELIAATAPLKDLSLYPVIDKINSALDSTLRVMNQTKDKYRLSRYSTEVLLSMKELEAEMKQEMDNVRLYRYVRRVQAFVDTVETEKRLSALKPMIEDVLAPMDTLAEHIDKRDVADVEKKLNYFGRKIQFIDSLVANTSQIPANVRREIPAFKNSFENVYAALNEIKNAINPADAPKLRRASDEIEKSLVQALNGYRERIYGGFFHIEHTNHGFIENGNKSWEER